MRCSSSSNMKNDNKSGDEARLTRLIADFVKKSKIIWLFWMFVCEAIVAPVVSSCLTFWNEATDFIVAYHAFKDGEVLLGTSIVMTPFLPALIIFIYKMNTNGPFVKKQFFPFEGDLPIVTHPLSKFPAQSY